MLYYNFYYTVFFQSVFSSLDLPFLSNQQAGWLCATLFTLLTYAIRLYSYPQILCNCPDVTATENFAQLFENWQSCERLAWTGIGKRKFRRCWHNDENTRRQPEAPKANSDNTKGLFRRCDSQKVAAEPNGCIRATLTRTNLKLAKTLFVPVSATFRKTMEALNSRCARIFCS